MYILLRDPQGRMIVRHIEYWEKFMRDSTEHMWVRVAEHVSSSTLLKMIEIATDAAPDDEKKRQETANNSPEHINKVEIIH